jgi:Skp family chaperone for outer membrane proteins
MKTFLVCLCAMLTLVLASTASAGQKLQHVVCFKFKSSAPAADVKKVEEAFQALKKRYPRSQRWSGAPTSARNSAIRDLPIVSL